MSVDTLVQIGWESVFLHVRVEAGHLNCTRWHHDQTDGKPLANDDTFMENAFYLNTYLDLTLFQ